MSLKILGLGAGRAGLITREAWQTMEAAEHLFLRTAIHPTVEALDAAGIRYTSYDSYYEAAESFAELYQKIATDVAMRAKEANIVYAVTGSPLVAEDTVQILRRICEKENIPLEILPGMSFLEVLYARLGIDPIDGVTILDAEQFSAEDCRQTLILTQVYNSFVASNTKLTLMEKYPDDYEIILVHRLSLSDEVVRKIPLFTLDRQVELDYLTTIVVPKYA